MLCNFTEKELLSINSCITSKIVKLKDSYNSCSGIDRTFFKNCIDELVSLRSSISERILLNK